MQNATILAKTEKKRKNVNGGIKEGNLSLKQTDVKMGDAMLQRDT